MEQIYFLFVVDLTNVTPADIEPVIVKVHWFDVAKVELQAPVQPEILDPVPGVAVRVTVVFVFIFAEHKVPQFIAPLLLVTVPEPDLETLRE